MVYLLMATYILLYFLLTLSWPPYTLLTPSSHLQPHSISNQVYSLFNLRSHPSPSPAFISRVVVMRIPFP